MEGDWSSKRVAVVGGGGFLGSQVVRELEARDCTPAVPRTADGWDFCKLENAQRYFEEVRPQIVFNCAARQGGLAYQQKFPAEIFDDNLRLGLNTMQAAREAGVEKYVNVVAACSYPGYVDGIVSEDDYWSGPLHESVLNYGFTKKAQVVQGWCYKRQFDFNSIHLLMTNMFGPGEHFHPDRSHGLAALLRKFYEAKRDNQPEVIIWGTGRPVREWLFVRDAAEAMILAAERYDEVEPINVSLGGGLSIKELALLIQDVVGYEGELVHDTDKPDGALMKAFANDRFREQVGWEPRTSLRDGIAETLAWFEANYETAIAH
ncbi:MAG: NAD-dependent epimerase/dehydratase family protein [Planctomycetota bacterium]|nr:MAG: NAD-dependent epimerase/dehydratase family protein [Planctomycetota bacterium]REJ94600.1 MAG: NAD-dependent epimerase/dehydratase family protein [Planctomycetota bacterium]REK29062.1 MAG: NAD-dependent epimerase/dehydratase family protein [Planctomycetota bacterium]REK46629.1 MAG: NAD-dependent epimerase/dehydratase family protein [Planctomycetota bacterium]